MIKIDKLSIARPQPNRCILKIYFRALCDEQTFLNYLTAQSSANFSIKDLRLFLCEHCSGDFDTTLLEILDGDLVVKEFKQSDCNDRILEIRFVETNTINLGSPTLDDIPAWPGTVVNRMLPFANTYIRNVWVNKKKDVVVVELSKGNKTKKIKVHKEKGVKFDVYAAVCAAMAIFEYGNNSKLKREIKRRTHYVESK